MKVEVLGSGGPIIRLDRGAPSMLVHLGGKKLLFDCGWGSGCRLLKAGHSLSKIDHIFISHPHADHIGNLMNILQSIHVSGVYFPNQKRERPLYLHGYSGFKEHYQMLRKIMYPEESNYDIQIFEYMNDSKEIDGLKITTIDAPHVQQYFNSVSFRVENGNEIFVYSGDSGFNDNLAKLAKDPAVFVCEMCIPPQIYHESSS